MLGAIKGKVSSNTNVLYAKGCDIQNADKSGFNEAIKVAEQSEIILMVLGEKSGLVPKFARHVISAGY